MSEVMTPDEINGLIERLQVDMNYLRRSDRAEMAQIGRDIEDAAFGLQRAQHQIVTAVSSITELTAEVGRQREALIRVDDDWTEAFPGGPDGPREYLGGIGHLSDKTIEVWRSIRAALSHEEGK
jgi:hypothetical protein